MFCKWRNERIRNRNLSARANHPQYAQEEQRSLSERTSPQFITRNNSNTLNNNNHNHIPHKNPKYPNNLDISYENFKFPHFHHNQHTKTQEKQILNLCPLCSQN